MEREPVTRDVTSPLAEIVSAVAGQFELNELLKRILETTMRLLNSEVCSIFLKEDGDPDSLICVAGSGFAERIIGKAEYKLGEGLTGKVAQGNKYKIDNRKQREELIKQGIWKKKHDHLQWEEGIDEFRNLIALPLKIKDQILGVIKVENKKPATDHFSQEDEQLFELIGNVIALAIENTRIQQAAETSKLIIAQTQSISKALSEIAGVVVGQFERDEVLNRILKTTMSLLDAEVCSIFLKKSDDPDKITCVAGSGFAERIIGKAEYKLGEGLTGKVAEGNKYKIDNREQREALIEQGIWKKKHDHLQWEEGKDEFRNLIALPLKIKDQILGVIKVENKKPATKHFSQEDDQLFELIGNVIALAIENTRVHQQAEAQSRAISEAMAAIASAVVGQFAMDKLLEQIIATTRNTLRADAGTIFLKESDDLLTCVAGAGFAQSIKGKMYKIGEGITGAFAKYGLSYNFKNRDEVVNYEINGEHGIERPWKGRYDEILWGGKQEERFHNLLIVSLKMKNDILGVMKIENKIGKDAFTAEDLTVSQTIANVIALTIENARLYEENEKQLKSISSRAAHRIGNQLAKYDYIELMLEEEANKETPERKKLFDFSKKIGEYTRNLKRTNTEFKDFGKPLVLKKEMNNLNDLIKEEILNAEHITNETKQEQGIDVLSNIRIIAKYDKRLPEFKFDGRLGESIKELITNAQRAISGTPGKKGEITIITEYLLQEDKEMAKIIIEDNGPGIPKNVPLFKEFYSTNPDRTGLGLSTVKRLLQGHGGDIYYFQVKGTRFELTLPIEKD